MRNKRKKKKKINPILKVILIILLVIISIIAIIAGSVFAVYKLKYNGNIKSMISDIASNFLEEVDPTYILVIGVSEDIATELADTIMLCGYNPQEQDAFILSIPRDTFVGKNINNGRAADKINAHFTKGIDDIKARVEEITGVEINHYCVVKTSMLVKIVDEIGGVDFDVPIKMDYDDKTQDLHIHLEPGLQRIDGDKAEQLLRFRHNNNYTTYSSEYGDNDFGRMRTQREFIKAIVEQTASLKNIIKIKEIANTVFDNLETDMDKDEMLAYIPHALEMDSNELKMEQLPGESKKVNEIWFYTYNKKQTEELMSTLTESFNKVDDTTTE